MAASAVILAFAAVVVGAYAAEPELTSDYFGDSAKVNASFFTFSGLREVTAPADQFLVKKASAAEFPALQGLGVSVARLSFMPNTVNPPHIHPRGTEVLFVEQGWLTVGLVDSTNKLFLRNLQKGDVFVFPRGLVHFQFNSASYEAKAFSAFSSSSAGTVSLPATLFGSNIDDVVLSKAFKVSTDVVKTIKSSFPAK